MIKDICIDLGSGMRTMESNDAEDWQGIDIRPFKGIKHVLDLGKDKLPYADNSVKFIRSIHLFEHFYSHELFHAIDECFRVLKPTGVLHIEVPLFCDDDGRITKAYVIHPDHKMHFAKDTFGFFQVPADVDRHGYLKGFWHLEFVDNPNPENISVNFFPNKPGIERYPYKEIKNESV